MDLLRNERHTITLQTMDGVIMSPTRVKEPKCISNNCRRRNRFPTRGHLSNSQSTCLIAKMTGSAIHISSSYKASPPTSRHMGV